MMLEHLVIENLTWINRKARQYYSDEFDAEDLASETIEKILRSKTKFDAAKCFRPWALAIMQNTYITQYNRRKCIGFTCMDDDFAAVSPYMADQHLTIRALLSVIRECSRKSVAVECVILYAKGYNYDEISRLLSIPIGTVMSRISNGRKMIHAALGL